MDKTQTVVLVVLVLFVLHSVNADLFYTGDIILKEENIIATVSYDNDNAILNVDATYTLKNNGELQTVRYDYFAFDQKVDGGKLALAKGEEKTLRLTKSKILKAPPYSMEIDFNLMLDGKYIGNKAERGEFVVRFPSKPTILSINSEPTTSSDLEFRWIKESYVPVFDIRLSWIRKEINIKLRKEITPSTIHRDEIFTVRAIIKNNDPVAYRCKIVDSYMMDYFTPVNKEEFINATPPEGQIEPSFWIFEREFTLKPNEERVFRYELRFLGTMGATEMNHLGFNFFIPTEKFFKQSERAHVDIEICNSNEICEPEIGENYQNCPQDCPKPLETLETTTAAVVTTTTLPLEKPKDLGDYLPYLLALFIIILLTFLIHRRQQGIKRRLKGEEKLRGWIEGQLRAGEDPEFLKKALEREGTDQAIVDEIMRKV